MFAGLFHNAGQSRLPGAGSSHSVLPTIAYVLTSPRRPGQSGSQPLCEYKYLYTHLIPESESQLKQDSDEYLLFSPFPKKKKQF